MTASNPYAGDPARESTWQAGYDTGYAEPEADHVPDVVEELLSAFQEGESAGRDDRRAEVAAGPPPPDPYGQPGVPETDATSEGEGGAEYVEPFFEPLIHVIAEKFGGAAGGLIALVAAVVQIPGDVQLRPPPPDYSRRADQPGDFYVAVCGESHGFVYEGVTAEGLWAGPGQTSFASADSDRSVHEHPQAAFVVLCSPSEGICGAVEAER